MQRTKLIPLALSLVGLYACSVGSGVNSAAVYGAQSGTIQLAVATDDASIEVVEFVIDEETVGRDEDGSDGWSVDFDTTKVDDGIHFVKAHGLSNATGAAIELLHNSILIDNGQEPAGETPAASDEEAF